VKFHEEPQLSKPIPVVATKLSSSKKPSEPGPVVSRVSLRGPNLTVRHDPNGLCVRGKSKVARHAWRVGSHDDGQGGAAPMASAFRDLAEIEDSFASAAVDPSRWNAAMDTAARATGSFGAIMLPVKGRLPLFPLSAAMHPIMDAYVREDWVHRDVRYRSTPALLARGVSTDFDFTTPEDMRRLPYYQEFLAPHGLCWFAGVKVGDGEDVWVLVLQHTAAQGPFTPTELRRLAMLSRRLSGAAELARAFAFARMEAALEAFEASGSAAAIVGYLGDVIRLNRSAERLLGEDLKIVKGRIVCADSNSTAALDRALHALVWSREAALHLPVVLPRKMGRPILAYPSSRPGVAHAAFAQCHCFVVFVDLEARIAAPDGDLTLAFGLTPAEARIASGLLAGASIDAVADKLGIAYETSRNQLKSVFQKTDTHRQGQLVSLLARAGRLGREAASQRY
jgi:DNA-binding CsgD family transcriptional regulator/PAS domain-containing protein